MNALSVEAAQARLLALASPLPAETVPLAEAVGRHLAEPMLALRDQPWADLSAMDGYAIRHADLPGPWTLAGASRAGALPSDTALETGQAMRIFTGAPLPPGADSVILQEDVAAEQGIVRMTGDGPGEPGRHVRRRASDFAQGDRLLEAGALLGPAQIGLAAIAGHGALAVHRVPRVAILSTGDELVPPGAPCPPGKLPASNGIMLRAMIASAGGDVTAEALIPDDLAQITAALRAAVESGVDIIVTSGGASVGDHDLVRPALEAVGATIDFWRVAMRPGKPLVVGRAGSAIVIGLPGNPVSALVTGALYLLPLIRHFAGAAEPLPRPRIAQLGSAMPAVGGRMDFVRATLDNGVATPLSFQDSAAMLMAARANALIVRPAQSAAAAAGDTVSVLDWAALGLPG